MDADLPEKKYSVEFDDEAVGDLDNLPQKARSQILKAVTNLTSNPRIGNVKPLKGYKGIYRLRTGDYRIIYSIEDDVLVVIIVAVGHRKDIYDVLKRRIL